MLNNWTNQIVCFDQTLSVSDDTSLLTTELFIKKGMFC